LTGSLAPPIGDHLPPYMRFRDAFPIFHTPDIERLAAFYCDQLGFERGYRFPDEGDTAFLVVTLGDLSIGLTQTKEPDEVGRVDLWLYTDDVDREVERLRENGATVVGEPADREWGERMATVIDPDGNFLHVGSR
jgi:lactoylglutathione lyase